MTDKLNGNKAVPFDVISLNLKLVTHFIVSAVEFRVLGFLMILDKDFNESTIVCDTSNELILFTVKPNSLLRSCNILDNYLSSVKPRLGK